MNKFATARAVLSTSATLVAATLLVASVGCNKTPEPESKATKDPAKPPADKSGSLQDTKPVPASSKATKHIVTEDAPLDPQRLVGQWVRADGGYVINIATVASDGKVKATYHNPGPINVESASASTDAGKLALRVKLNDQGYPGCVYELDYDGKNDKLVGTYFQAAAKQTYRVSFQRQP